MIRVEQALKTILHYLPPSRLEYVPLSQALGSVIAEDVYSDIDLPPFNKSAMDGYAVRIHDLKKIPVELNISEIVPAGNLPHCRLKRGEAVKIMTGAPVPRGADTVVMVEDTQTGSQKDSVRFLKQVRKDANICYRGEDLKQGKKVIAQETLIRPQEIGILAAVGQSRIKVYQKPQVAILATGDELIGIETCPRGAQIRNSNDYALAAQITQMGLHPIQNIIRLGTASDNTTALAKKITAGLKSDILIITGGVSVGEYDLVKEVLQKLKVKISFQKVAIKPGKPFVFGKKGQCLVFGLPGNPVSCFVLTEIFIRPAIAHFIHNPALIRFVIKARVNAPFTKVSNRKQYLPAYTESISVGRYVTRFVGWHGSADLVSLGRANSLAIIPVQHPPLKRDDEIAVMLLAPLEIS